MAQPPVVTDQTFTPFPKLTLAFVESNGDLKAPWHRFLIALWRKTGGSSSPETGALYLSELPSGSTGVFNQKGALVGVLQLENQPGQPAEPLGVGGSPFVFKATVQGTLVVFAAEAELTRDGVTWTQVTLNGGAVPVRVGDQVRVTWYSAEAPKVTFFPDNTGA